MSARPSSLRQFVLGLLSQQPMSGYDIRRVLKGLGWLVGEPSFGSLYPALKALEMDGLVTMEQEFRQNGRQRKTYSITAAGRQRLEEWINRPAGSNASLKAFVMRLIQTDNLSQAGLIAQLYQRRSQILAHRAALERTTALAEEGANSGQRLALEYGLALADAEITWLDSTLDRLSTQSQAAEVVPDD